MFSTTVYRSRIVFEAYTGWIQKADNVLDVGCGTAIVADEVKRHFECSVIGTDILDYRKRDISFKIMTSDNHLPFSDNAFDVAMFNDALHHCARQEDLLREAGRVAKKVLLFEMKPTFLAKSLDILINQFYNSKMNIPLNLKSYEGWQEFFRNNGFDVVSRPLKRPNIFYPFTHFAFCLTKK